MMSQLVAPVQGLAVVKEAEDVGLTLNSSKCEIVTRNHTTFGTILTLLPGAHMFDPAYATLLGSPLGDGRCISRVTGEKSAVLRRVGEGFVALSANDAFFLLQHSFAISELQYLLCTASSNWLVALVEYDKILCSIIGEVTNTVVVSGDMAWKLESLPVKFGGLDVYNTVEVAPSAYLASLHVTSTLVEVILLMTFPPLSHDCLMMSFHAG